MPYVFWDSSRSGEGKRAMGTKQGIVVGELDPLLRRTDTARFEEPFAETGCKLFQVLGSSDGGRSRENSSIAIDDVNGGHFSLLYAQRLPDGMPESYRGIRSWQT